jgi:hypothetical protein
MIKDPIYNTSTYLPGIDKLLQELRLPFDITEGVFGAEPTKDSRISREKQE